MRRVVLVVLVAILTVACGQSEDSIDEVGEWDVGGDGIAAIATYSEDGTYNIAPLVDDVALTAFDMGTYVIEDGTLTYTSSAAAVGCAEGDQGRYEFVAGDSGSWTLNLLEDDCAKRAEGGPFVHTRRE